MLSICAIEGTRWEFLSKAQRNSATIERKVLVTRCCDDMSLINFLCNSVRGVSDGTHQTKVRITFATAVLIEVLERCKNDQERKKAFLHAYFHTSRIALNATRVLIFNYQVICS